MTIRIDQPREHDLVGNPVLVGGVGTGFEATLSYRVHDGHDEVTGFLTVGGGTGEQAQYQVQVDVSGAAATLCGPLLRRTTGRAATSPSSCVPTRTRSPIPTASSPDRC